MPTSKRKRPQDWTTEEAIRRVFPKRVADALRDAVGDPGDILPEHRSDKRPPTKKGR